MSILWNGTGAIQIHYYYYYYYYLWSQPTLGFIQWPELKNHSVIFDQKQHYRVYTMAITQELWYHLWPKPKLQGVHNGYNSWTMMLSLTRSYTTGCTQWLELKNYGIIFDQSLNYRVYTMAITHRPQYHLWPEATLQDIHNVQNSRTTVSSLTKA